MLRLRLLILAVLSGVSCTREQPQPPASDSPPNRELLPPGESRLAVPGGSIWYKVSGAGGGLPVITLHGGPGFSSHYLKPLEALGDERPIVRYDQLGSGKSERVSDTTLFTVQRFVAELDSLRSALGYPQAHIVGHSWGTMLAVEYYRAHPDRVASLVLASPALSAPEWERTTRALLRTLPASTQRVILESEKAGTFDTPAYQAAVGEFYNRYVWRRPVQADLDSTMASMNQGIYLYMWGPSEFTVTGTLKTFDVTPDLKTIGSRVPVMFTVGEFDEAGPATVRRQAAMTPGAEFVVIDSAAHMVTWDNPAQFVDVLRGFLRRVESGERRR